jgi:hypothetical protein
MKNNFSYLILACLFCLSSLTVAAQNYSLKPGESVTVNFDLIRLLEKGTPPVAYRNVGALATFTLNASGTGLTVNLQNLSLPESAAALYALDLGLTKKLALQTQGQMSAGKFSPNAVWLGPTDNESVTYGTGSFTFAARDAVLGQMLDFTESLAPLPASFFTSGQQGSFTVQFNVAEEAKDSVLRFRPVAYFVAPDTRSATPKRLRLAAFGKGQSNNLR